MIGSINKIWPWKEVIEYRTNSKGEQKPFITENILPEQYATITGEDPHILYGVIFFIVGIVVVYAIDQLAKRVQKQ
jgi:putative membrane protein